VGRDPEPEPLEERCLLTLASPLMSLSRLLPAEMFQVRRLAADPFQISLAPSPLSSSWTVSSPPAGNHLWDLLSPRKGTTPPVVVVEDARDQTSIQQRTISGAEFSQPAAVPRSADFSSSPDSIEVTDSPPAAASDPSDHSSKGTASGELSGGVETPRLQDGLKDPWATLHNTEARPESRPPTTPGATAQDPHSEMLPGNQQAQRLGAPGAQIVSLPDRLIVLPSRVPGLIVAWAGPRAAWSQAQGPKSTAWSFKWPGRLGWTEWSLLAIQAFYLASLRVEAGVTQPSTATGTLPPETRLLIADLLRSSTEAFTRLVRGFFQTFMGRPPAVGEEMGWVELLLRGQTEEMVLAIFLSTEEFGDRATLLAPAPTADESFIQALHALLLQRQATDAEQSTWLLALARVGRAGVASVLLASNEYRRLRIAAMFEELTEGPAKPAEVAAWAATPFPLLDIRRQIMTRADL
jgi:hypothetical protein